MKLIQVEAEEPPSRPRATSRLLIKPQSPINALSPAPAPSAKAPLLGAVVVRMERFPIGPISRAFRKRYYPEVDAAQWNDWRWQARSRIRTLAELERIFVLSDDERDAVVRHQGSLPLGITPYYASLMAREDATEPLRRTHIPVGDEYLKSPGEADDPLGEDGHTAAPGLVHRYPDRVLLPGDRLLLDLLPLLHALAHGRRGGRRLHLQPAAMGGGAQLYRDPSRDPRRADFRRRSADALGRAARLSAREAQGHQACRVRPARHQGAGRAADAGDARAHPRAQEAPSAVDEPPLHPSRPS